MKLRNLRLHGFKSFADKTDVKFHDGITAIVGPNGCGKSNISDAIRWVLGEQRPSAIRGGKMEEAIFQGTVQRRAVNRGTVALTVSNDEGMLPVPYKEVELGRTVYRDGGSEYSINRSICRLRDVVDLYRDTGLGANAYAVIEGRMIDAILSDRAEERRSLFEEAAGIGKYKDRRKAALRRLERAEADLQRIDDVIGEVQTKVRSLARQKGKAQRYLEMRDRRLSVEVTVVRTELEKLQERLQSLELENQNQGPDGAGMAAELAAAETAVETLRLRQADAERLRMEATRGLEEIRTQLVDWERDLAVAAERESYAERRLAQLAQERTEHADQLGSHGQDRLDLERTHSTRVEELERSRKEVDDTRGAAEAVRERLLVARSNLDLLEQSERDVARKGAQLEGDGQAAEAQAGDLAKRISAIQSELEEASRSLKEMESQGDLFLGQLDQLTVAVDERVREEELCEAELENARAALDKARAEEIEWTERAARLRAEIDALDRMEREGEGSGPAVQAALRQRAVDVAGTLMDSISGPPEAVRAVETFLGPLVEGILVETREDAEALATWFHQRWNKGGGLCVLPLDSVPKKRRGGDLVSFLTLSGPGADWARALLSGVQLTASGSATGSDASPAATIVDSFGVVRVGRPGGAGGMLERAQRLKVLRKEAETVFPKAYDSVLARGEALTGVRTWEDRLDQARARSRAARDARQQLGAEADARSDRRSLIDRHRDELTRRLEGTGAAQARAFERARTARAEREVILEEEQQLRTRREVARTASDAVQAEWEDARTEESRVTVALARVESDVSRLHDRIEHLEAAETAIRTRIEAADVEESSLRSELEAIAQQRSEGEEATARLFGARDAATSVLRERETESMTLAEQLSATETEVRRARTMEREATERRHRIELERQDARNRVERIRERLEAEWGKPLERLLEEADPAEGDPAELADELETLVEQLGHMGPVNMLAVEEHEEESARLEFLTDQRDDLVSARDDLRAAIREINHTATSLFLDTFKQIQQNFRDTFIRLFQGGEAEIWLADLDDPLESPIEIHASPRGKKTQRIDLLSGGERALTALSLLFGIYLVKPSPFCVLDEVDAPLDEANIGRFIRLLEEFKSQTQFVVITHNPRTIEAADWIYGVTMEEPGVSNIVGVRLDEALAVTGAA